MDIGRFLSSGRQWYTICITILSVLQYYLYYNTICITILSVFCPQAHLTQEEEFRTKRSKNDVILKGLCKRL